MTKKKIDTAPVLFPYYMEVDRTCVFEDEGEEEFDSYSYIYENSFKSIHVKAASPNLVSSLDFSPGDKAFLVWIEYSSGDSFGSSTRAHSSAIALFKDRESAQALKDCQAFWSPGMDPTQTESSYRPYFESPDGQVISLNYAEWDDYFGGLDEIHIQEVIFEP